MLGVPGLQRTSHGYSQKELFPWGTQKPLSLLGQAGAMTVQSLGLLLPLPATPNHGQKPSGQAGRWLPSKAEAHLGAQDLCRKP